MDCDELFDPRIEKWCSADMCHREVVHHPRKGGSSNFLGELTASAFRLRFTSMQSPADAFSIYNKGFLHPLDIPITSIYRITLFNRKKRHKKEVTAGDILRGTSEEFDSYSSMIICCADFMIYKFSTVSEEVNFPTDFLNNVINFGSRRRPKSQFGIILGEKKLYSLDVVHTDRSADDAWLTKFPLKKLLRRQRLSSEQKSDSSEHLASHEFDPDSFLDYSTPRISCVLGSEFTSVLVRCGKIAKNRRNTIEHELRDACQRSGFLHNVGGKSTETQQQHVRIVKLKSLGLPRPEEVQSARRKLREAALGYDPAGNTTMWLDQVDATQWMVYVSRALKAAVDIAGDLQRDLGTARMVSEGTDSDWNCVICSLVNLLLFPRLRSIEGLQEVIVREWCVAGHAFSSRLEVAYDCGGGPLFPLFLDCVQQLWSQFPQCFSFTPEFLILLHDLCHAGLFREFLVHVERHNAALAPSVFGLKTLLSPDGLRLLENPVFGLAVEMWQHEHPQSDEPDLAAQLEGVCAGQTWLEVDWEVRFLRFWRENYFRALPFMNIGQAGRPAELWRCRELLQLARKKRMSLVAPAVLGMVSDKEAADFSVQLRNEAKVFQLPSGADFDNVTAFFPFVNDAEQVGKSARASCFPGRGVSHFDMYGDVNTL